MIELDVRFSKDGELMVIHDQSVDKTTNGHGLVSEKTIAEIKTFNAGKGENISTLQEVLTAVDKKALVNIDLKDDYTGIAVAKIIEQNVLNNGWFYDMFVVSSVHESELISFHRKLPYVSFGYIGDSSKKFLHNAEIHGAKFVSVYFDGVDARYVQSVHKKGMIVYIWTLNNKTDIEKMKELRVDGIISNYPDRI